MPQVLIKVDFLPALNQVRNTVKSVLEKGWCLKDRDFGVHDLLYLLLKAEQVILPVDHHGVDGLNLSCFCTLRG